MPTTTKTARHMTGLLLCLLAGLGWFGCDGHESNRTRAASDADSFNKESFSADLTQGECGDGWQGFPETCDGADMGGATCDSLGYGGGSLACDEQCEYDVSDCEGRGQCGDGILNPGEECEVRPIGLDPQLRGVEVVYAEGLECRPGRAFCSTECTLHGGADCGDGIASWPSEECDGDSFHRVIARPFSTRWISLDQYDSEALRCDSDCNVDLSDAGPAVCGNRIVEAGEACDETVTRERVTMERWTCLGDCSGIRDLGSCGDGFVQPAYETCDSDRFRGPIPTCREFNYDSDEPVQCNNLTCQIDRPHCFRAAEAEADGFTSADDAGDPPDSGPAPDTVPPPDTSTPVDAVAPGASTPVTDDDAGCSARPALPSSGPACLVLLIAGWSLSRRRR